MYSGTTVVSQVVWRYAVFWDITQRIVVIHCRRFGTTIRPLFRSDLLRWDRQFVPNLA